MLILSNFHFKRLLAPSEALVFIMVYYIPRKPLFQIFQIRKGKWKWKNLTSAIFLKSLEFKDIKYDIPVCQIHYIYKDIYKDIHILTERPVVLLNAIFYEESRWAEAYIGCWKFQLAQIYNWTL